MYRAGHHRLGCHQVPGDPHSTSQIDGRIRKLEAMVGRPGAL